MANEWMQALAMISAQNNAQAAQAQADKMNSIGADRLAWEKAQEEKYAPYNQKILDAQLDNFSRTNAASDRAAAAAEKQLAIAEANDKWARENQAKYDPLIQQIINGQLTSQKEAGDFARQQRDFYNQEFMPRQKAYLSEVESYGNRADQERVGSQAAAAVMNNNARAMDAAKRQLMTYGIKPGDGGFTSSDIRARTDAAAAAAGQSTAAMNATRQQGMALRGQALAQGQNQISNFANLTGVGANIGNSAIGGMNNSLTAGAGALNAAAGMYGVGNSANNSAIGGYGTGANIGATAQNGINNNITTYANAANGAVPWYNGGSSMINAGMNSLNNLTNNLYAGYNNANQGGSGWGSLFGFGAGAFAGSEAGSNLISSGIKAAGPALMTAAAGLAEGGAIPDHASPTGGAAIDDVPARLTAGEFVIPKDTLQWKGEEFFQKLIEQSRKAKEQAVAKPEIGIAPHEPPTFVSRPQGGALPLG